MASPFRSLAPTTPRTEDIPGLDYRAAPLAKGMQFQHIRNWSLRATTPITPRIIGMSELDYRAVPLDFPIYLRNQSPQTITFNNPGDQFWNGSVDLASFASASSGLLVSFTVDSGPGILTGTVLTFSNIGPVTITAHQGGNSQWNPAPDVSQIIQALPADQSIAFAPVVDQYWPTPLDLVASCTSGLPVTFTVDVGPATIVGTQAVFSDSGSVTITAHQGGNSQWNPAPDVPQTFNVLPIDQTITFANPGDCPILVPLDLVATADSGLTVTFTVDSGPATIVGSQAIFSANGPVTITAHQYGDSRYNIAPYVSQTFNVIPVPAQFRFPNNLALDSAGNIFVADTNNHTIRKITPLGVVTTFAGQSGVTGHADGIGATATFWAPGGICIDAADNMYVIDTFNYTVRKITPSAAVTTLAGLAGAAGCTNGTGSAARFGYYPQGITCTPAGMIYVADTNAHTIRQVNQAGVVITLAGSCNVTGHADGTGSAARFKSPGGLVVDAYNDIYVADTSNYTVRKVTAGGVVTTVAGLALTAGHVDATGSSARFYYLHSIVADLIGNLYVFDSPAIIRKIAPGFVVTTFAGLYNTPGTTDGNGASARLNFGNLLIPGGMAGGFVDPSGNVYFADTSNYTIRRMSPTGDVVTLAGQAGNAGDADYP